MTDWSENPYTPPKADVGTGLSPIEIHQPVTARIYSSKQIYTCTFFGGPLAGLWLLKSNFDSLNRPHQSRATVQWGLFVCLIILVVIPILPDRFPNFALPFGYATLAWACADDFLFKKVIKAESIAFDLNSNWRAAGVSFIGFLIFFLIVVAYMLSLNALGFLHLA